MKSTLLSALAIASLVFDVSGHGYMTVPKARQLIHKGGPLGEGDIMSLSGGGASADQSNGHGLCGDNSGRKAFMAPSQYGPTDPTISYVAGQWIDIEVTVTAHHWGWFEFRLCRPADGGIDKSVPITQECLNQYVLKMDVDQAISEYGNKMRSGQTSPVDYEGGSEVYNIEHAKCPHLPASPLGSCCNKGGNCDGPTRWVLPDPSKAGKIYKMRYQLPQGVTCERCVLQWFWQTGNSPGSYPEGFWNCADIKITKESGTSPNAQPTSKPPTSQPPTSEPPAPITQPPSEDPPTSEGKLCVSIKSHISDTWCRNVNCDPIYYEFCEWKDTESNPSALPTTQPPTSKPPTTQPPTTKPPTTQPPTTKPPTNQPPTTQPPSSGGKVCVSISHISDAWCRGVNCDPAYVQFCQWKDTGATPSTQPSSYPPTTTPPTTKPPTATTTTLPPSAMPGTPGEIKNTLAALTQALSSSSGKISSDLLVYETPTSEWVESDLYQFKDLLKAVEVMSTIGAGSFKLDIGNDGEGSNAYLYGLVNIAAFLAQSMKEAIKYNACDENSWDLINSKYPLSNACGQLGQSYQDYKCGAGEEHMACDVDPEMEIVATTNAKWYGAPGPLRCGPKSKTGQTGYWDYSKQCGPWASEPCDDYEGQKAGGVVDVPTSNRNGRTDVEGCCWWGRGVIQTTGICNFGKLNYFLGERAAKDGRTAPYPEINFCRTPDAICSSTDYPELKWVAGFFYWLNSMQTYSTSEFDFSKELRAFVNGGLQGTSFIDKVSGVVNRGCPRTTCATGAVDGLADRRSNFEKALKAMNVQTLLSRSTQLSSVDLSSNGVSSSESTSSSATAVGGAIAGLLGVAGVFVAIKRRQADRENRDAENAVLSHQV